ncbi:MAG: maltose alpha-D-glucosyltransferase [Vicinamibacterales bacterium]
MSTLERTIDPLWYKDAIIYQLHVKSFFDSTNDGIGDFQGLTQKLDYLQSLGVTCVWLLPFFPSPLKDDGYDISDYCNVHPSYGTIDDFRAFVDAAHQRNIHVLIELVVNHTSDQHPWFQRARQAPPGSPERDFYIWSDSDQKFPETRIIFTDTERSNWGYDPVAKQYYWHRFFAHQPDLNHNNPAVVAAVLDVMKFWFDAGVDAMRLDAVPYLCVREGTNNENLPETHGVLKRIRHELDAAYENRMLLAEANQWPADVRAYFGDGDECHMAFHFPLMPRMFMALRQEDRHAVTEILNQTPEIPESCQWAIFLRNHDELTLEMVTDEERDYMYSAYAADPQMRINVGIRRRLTPLMEGSRRRVELLNMLLFSMPGTPIVYYGDEIGMGDNIYLGDRNGVRTPMQWSSDRNGGFSRADTARLYAPAIVDPLYGFQSINVEAQERAPYSLLNWMKRLIALRKQHRVFGRGSMEIIYCANRKVLAYLRRDDQETVLVVANLSRTFQAVELDLHSCAGLTPVEMLGLTSMPRIAEDKPYFLTLGPYAAHWFSLVAHPLQITQPVTDSVGAQALSPGDALPALLIGVNWETVFDSGARQVLERQALAAYLKRQRWFASKSRTMGEVRFSDWAMLRGGSTPAFMVITSVSYTDGWTESYLTPFALVSGDQADRIVAETPSLVLAKITGARKGAIVDGTLDDDTCNRLIALVQSEQLLRGARGAARGVLTTAIDLPGDRKWVRGGLDQSNTVAFVNERYALKLFRRIEPGPNPEFEIGRALTALGFTRIATLAGAIEYERTGLEAGTLAVIQAAITNQGSGWTFTIDELRRYYERVIARISGSDGERTEATEAPLVPDDAEPPPFFSALQGWYLSAAATLGRRTAEMHLMLASARGAAFDPEPLDRQALELFVRDAAAHADGVLDRLASRLDSLPEHTRPTAEAVLAARHGLIARLTSMAHIDDGGMRTRVHGDYHLGQVLHVEEDFVILDFEGEPARTLAERRAKYSPLKDVAGMLRSFNYAAHAALFAFSQSAPGAEAQLSAWADAWHRWVSRAFLSEYRATMAGSPVLPSGDAFDVLLHGLVVDKAIYELGYELNSRPDWARIPLDALATLALPLQR